MRDASSKKNSQSSMTSPGRSRIGPVCCANGSEKTCSNPRVLSERSSAMVGAIT